MQPTSTDVHVNSVLSAMSVAYMQDQANFIADKVFPAVPVQKQSDRYYVYDRDAWFRSDAEEVAPSAEAPTTGYTLDNTPTYYARVYRVKHRVDGQIIANADGVLNLDRDATELVTQQLLQKRENLFITNYFGTGIWTGATDQTGVASSPSTNQFLQWDLAGSTPIEDVQSQIINIAEKTGKKPNKLVIGPRVAMQLLNNPEIVDRVKFTQLGFLNYQLLAQAFGVEEVLVPYATQNTATEKATLAMAMMYGKSAMLVYAAPNPGLMTVSAGYTFPWTGYLNTGLQSAIRKYPRIEIDAGTYEVEGAMAFDMKVIAADCGMFFTSVVS